MQDDSLAKLIFLCSRPYDFIHFRKGQGMGLCNSQKSLIEELFGSFPLADLRGLQGRAPAQSKCFQFHDIFSIKWPK